MSRWTPVGSGLLLAVLALCIGLLQGCEKRFDPMEPPPGHGPYTGTVDDWPLWFVQHRFASKCFSVHDCTVSYAGQRIEKMTTGPRPSVESLGFPLEKILSGSISGIVNFPPPAKVDWVAMDGTHLSATVDMAEIFKDRLLVHSTPREAILEHGTIPPPDIVLVVDDRRIDVYMRTYLFLKELRDPTNPHSNFRSEVVRVHSREY